MKQFISSLMVIGALAFFVGCGDEVKTEEYYKEHLEEARAKEAKCEKMKTRNENQEKDCLNAKFAVFKYGGSGTNLIKKLF